MCTCIFLLLGVVIHVFDVLFKFFSILSFIYYKFFSILLHNLNHILNDCITYNSVYKLKILKQ